MKKYGEVISSSGSHVAIRVYKEKFGEGVPTALKVNAKASIPCSVGDFVAFDMRTALFSLVNFAGYAIPFIVSLCTYLFTRLFTSNLLIIQPVFLISLLVCYVLSVKISSLPFFKQITLCRVTEITEE